MPGNWSSHWLLAGDFCGRPWPLRPTAIYLQHGTSHAENEIDAEFYLVQKYFWLLLSLVLKHGAQFKWMQGDVERVQDDAAA